MKLETISKTGYDLCINCGKETKYLANTPIAERYNYVKDAGQLCDDCYIQIYGTEIKPLWERRKRILGIQKEIKETCGVLK